MRTAVRIRELLERYRRGAGEDVHRARACKPKPAFTVPLDFHSGYESARRQRSPHRSPLGAADIGNLTIRLASQLLIGDRDSIVTSVVQVIASLDR